MKNLKFFLVICIMILLCGCASSQTDDPQQPNGQIQVGKSVYIDPLKQLTVSEYNDILAADGLYYATWTDGEAVPYENSEGESVNLYDAQLYFLADECPDEAQAEKNCNAWLSTAKENYQVYSEKTMTFSDQSYTVIYYTCSSDTNPYDHGISAFCTNGANAYCIELTCTEKYTKELEPILTDFLNGCHYQTK